MRNLFARIAVLAVLLFALSPSNAQNTTTSALTGVVTDSTGAVVQGATVTLVNPGKGTSFTAKTDSNGAYRFNGIVPGPGYAVTISRDGFATTNVKDMYLAVSITRTQNVQLVAGSSAELSVSAGREEATLNTTDASIGNNINVEMIQDLPIQSRTSPSVLMQLQPGVVGNSVTGARTDQSNVTLDGMDVNDNSTGQAFSINGGAPVDAIQEFRGTVAGLQSQIGTGSGGQFQFVIKSGTNRFHGNVNEYHRDTTTTANTWFNKNSTSPLPRTALIRNQFGGAIGGPILRDKLFFFFDINLSRIASSSQASRTVPLDSFRAGRVGYISNQAGCVATGAGAARRNNPATAYCIKEVSGTGLSALDPQGLGANANVLALFNARYPHANDLTGGDGVNTGAYRFSQRTPNNVTQYVGKVNYNLTPKQQIYLQYHTIRQDSTQALNQYDTDGFTYPFQDRSYGYVVSHIWQIGANKVNQFYFGSNVTKFNFPVNLPSTPYGATNSYSFSGLTAPYGSFSSQKRRVPVPEFRDDFNWVVGHHNIAIGGQFKFIKTNSNLTNDFVFPATGIGGTLTTLNSTLRPADILASTTARTQWDNFYTDILGRLAQVSSNYNYDATGKALANGTGANRSYRYYQTELYVGDSWKVSPELTVTYGVRYQLYSVPYEVRGIQSNQNFNFTDYVNARVAQSSTGKSGAASLPFVTYNLGGKANNAAPSYNPSYKDLAPRVAFAYQPSNTKTVINGGFGLVYDRTVVNALNFIQDQSSYLFQNSTSRTYGGATANDALLNNPRLGSNLSFPAAPAAPTITRPFTPYVTGGAGTGLTDNQFNYQIDPNFKTPYSLTFNAGLQQELGGGMILRLNYAGRLGKRLIGQSDASQLIDFRDNASGQMMSTAFANLTRQLRANPTITAAQVTKQPWFENQIGTGGTAFLVNNLFDTIQIGDVADTVQALQANGFIDYNVGLPSQFAGNTFITNQGFSRYHGMLLTLQQNPRHGLRYDLNYTWSHSMDNVSAVANSIGSSTGLGQICDALNPRKCYGNSDFDATHQISSDWLYELPFGRGRMFGSRMNRALDLAVGGWAISGITAWRSGLAFTTTTGAYVLGYANNSPAIFNGDTSATRVRIHKNAAGQLVLFDDPTRAAAAFQGPIGFQTGSRNSLRGPGNFTFDAGLAKTFQIIENKVWFKFRADAFNVLNHPNFALPATANTNVYGSSFGQLTGTTGNLSGTGADNRVAQFSGRIEF